MADDRSALRRGREQAERIIKFRDQAVSGIATLGTAGILVAEGDSWFDYPFRDIIETLEDKYGYDVESVAHKGDRVEEMAYDGGQLEEFTRRIEKVIAHGKRPRAILLSGGGNDVAGREFGMLLNHVNAPNPGLNNDILRGLIHDRIRAAYVTILAAVTAIVKRRIGERLRIIVHGYDFPVPDGRGFAGGWGILPGPWLEPGFREKGYMDIEVRTAIAKQLIDEFNVMLKDVAAIPALSHVRYLDLRGTLNVNPKVYKKWWANELHPTHRGFDLVTKRFHDAVEAP